MQPSLRPLGLWYSSSRQGGTDPEQEALPDSRRIRTQQMSARYIEVDSSHQRQQGQQHSREDKRQILSGFQVETQEPLVQRSSKSSTALLQVFSMNSMALMKSGSGNTKADEVLLQANFSRLYITTLVFEWAAVNLWCAVR